MATVLIVDDDQTLTQVLSVRLKKAGFDVLIANDAIAASPIALRHRPDVILLDVDMPHFTGPEFHECLRRTGRGAAIPVVYLSGRDSTRYSRVAYEQGARLFVAKPYDSAQLIEALHEIIASPSDVGASG